MSRYDSSHLTSQILSLQEEGSRRGLFSTVEHQEFPLIGQSVITLPQFKLPDGWNKEKCNITFILNGDYPYIAPQHFWTEYNLRLLHAGMPGNTAFDCPHFCPVGCMKFYFRAYTWSPDVDNLVTWMYTINRRLGYLI